MRLSVALDQSRSTWIRGWRSVRMRGMMRAMAGTQPPTPPASMEEADHVRGASFAAGWDDYVDQAKATGQAWPGDDWGDESLWSAWFERLLLSFGADRWQKAVEIGQGTGKYTRRVLEAGTAEVLACDVSARFLGLCAQRQAKFVDAGRLHLAQIAEDDPRAVQGACDRQGWSGQVDALFSIDTLVHLPYSRTVAYLVAGSDSYAPAGSSLAPSPTAPTTRRFAS